MAKKYVTKVVIEKKVEENEDGGMSVSNLSDVLEMSAEILSSPKGTEGVRGVVIVAKAVVDEDGEEGFKIIGGRRRMSVTEVYGIMCAATGTDPKELAEHMLETYK